MNPIIPENNDHGFFKNIKTFVGDDGKVFRTVDTEVFECVSVGKSKVNDLLPILRLMAIDWKLNLSKAQDMQIAKLKLNELVRNN
jgi:hypothetical protein